MSRDARCCTSNLISNSRLGAPLLTYKSPRRRNDEVLRERDKRSNPPIVDASQYAQVAVAPRIPHGLDLKLVTRSRGTGQVTAFGSTPK